MATTWLITAASRGLGRALAQTALDDGDVVVAASRSGDASLRATAGSLHTVTLDVAEPGAADDAVKEALALVGHPDIVVNNAGQGLLGAIEETSDEEVAEVLNTNLVGPLRVARAVLRHLRTRRSGRIVNVSSIAALDPLAGSGVYAAAKAGLSALSDALAEEVEPLGVQVMAVEPGAFRTEFLSAQSIRRTTRSIEDYATTSGAVLDRLDSHAGRQPGDPARAARVIVDATRSATPPRHLVLGDDALRRTRKSAARLLTDLDTWQARSLATAFSDH